jgi:phosphatidylinositol alpha-mannosyltransferase
MRIAQICPYSWTSPGGVQAHVRNLSRHLIRRGHDVLVVTPGEGGPVEEHVSIVGRPLPIRFNGSSVPLCPNPLAKRPVRDALREFAPDVVHVHEPFAPSTSYLGVVCSEAPVVATFHTYHERHSFGAVLYRTLVPLFRPVWDRIDLHIAVSEAAASCVGARAGGIPRVIPNGVAVEHFAGARPADLPPGRKLLFVGRLEPRKGFRVAVRAFARLAERYPDLLLVAVGDGGERDAVRLLDRRLRRRVLMEGQVSNTRLPGYYAAADAFVAPAVGGESFGIVLAEAMSAGLPVIASDIPGFREVVRHRREGLLVPPGEPAALADALGEVLDAPALARALGAAGRVRARAFSWEAITTRLEGVYEEAIGAREARRDAVAAGTGVA